MLSFHYLSPQPVSLSCTSQPDRGCDYGAICAEDHYVHVHVAYMWLYMYMHVKSRSTVQPDGIKFVIIIQYHDDFWANYPYQTQMYMCGNCNCFSTCCMCTFLEYLEYWQPLSLLGDGQVDVGVKGHACSRPLALPHPSLQLQGGPRLWCAW